MLCKLRFWFAPSGLVLLALASCSGATAPAQDSTDSTGAAGAPPVSAGGTAPGRYLTNTATTGTASCAGISLTDVLIKIRAAEPSLADVQTIYNPASDQSGGDGSFIYPYARGDGGFDVVFKRGLGDCPAGCTENDYLYFSTDASCRPARVGHYHAGWGDGTCLSIEGVPMWNHPAAPDPAMLCGQDLTAQDIHGTYQLRAAGQRTACAAGAKSAALEQTVTLSIAQDAGNPGTGTVTFTGTGNALVDGVPLPALFQRRRFDAATQWSNESASCPRGSSVTARFDFEGYQPGGIETTQLGDSSCAACKGSMSVTLTAP